MEFLNMQQIKEVLYWFENLFYPKKRKSKPTGLIYLPDRPLPNWTTFHMSKSESPILCW